MERKQVGKKSRGLLLLLMAAVMVAALCLLAVTRKAPSGGGEAAAPADEVAAVILHTNDVHCGFEENIGYDGLALYKKELERKYSHVFLVDAGDFIQGGPIGAISKGQEIIRFMNFVGYDVATLGNHEFDFGPEPLADCEEAFEGTFVCANYCTSDGTPIFAPWKILDAGGVRIALVGAVTPEVFTKTTLHEIVNESGEAMYCFFNDETGDRLRAALQNAVDEARAQGADVVILLAHLGNNEAVEPQYKMEHVLAGLSGVDAVIDGHSHQTFSMTLPDRDGRQVTVGQTGTKLASVGQLTVYRDGHIEGTLVGEVPEPEDPDLPYETVLRDGAERRVDPDTKAFMDEAWAAYADEMNRRVGELPFDMFVRDGSGEISRMRENALCNLVTDAYRAAGQTQIAFINAGAVRNNLPAGELTYQSILSILPYSNDVVTVSISGQTLLDALENGASGLPRPQGRLLQVSGMSYTVDQSKESTVRYDAEGHFVAVTGDYRVHNVLVGGEPLDLQAEYTATTSNFILGGADGYDMLMEGDLLTDPMVTDNEAAIRYIQDVLGGVIPDVYRSPQGRITVIG
ncbi:MAG: bifunctional metallophosphatase/5'-nucleotidase [Oscillospiraceae bacterium]|nr:bifunctional metallophosphatase/5'-nucleotidase [Oscillospiraceae bacterium]